MKFNRIYIMTAILAVFALGEIAHAQVDEVVVTGRLKDELISDIPASVVAFEGEVLQERGVVDLELLQHTVPNFRYTTSVGVSDNLVIRGIGTIGSGPHFEPGVGQQFNGVAYTRSRLGRAGLIDTAQVEVLRGPQGAVTGRNTSLGLINIVPNKPTDTFQASLFTRYDTKAREGYQVEGVVSGPIFGDSIRGRLAFNYKDQDGYIDNAVTGGTAGTKDDITVRGILDFDLGERGNFEILAQNIDAERDGKLREVVECSAAALADPYIGRGDCSLNRSHNNQAVIKALDDEETVRPERFSMDFETYIGTLNFDITDNIRLTSITSYSEYRITDVIDTDLSPKGRLDNAALANRNFVIPNAEEYEQTSQELRLSGNLFENTSYILGALYNEYTVDFAQNSNTEGVGPGPYQPANRHQFANQENEGTSVFLDLTHDLSEQYRISAGIRYIEEDRAARAGQILTRTGTALEESNLPGFGPGPNCLGRSGLLSCSMFPTIPTFTDGDGDFLNVPANADPWGILFQTNLVPDGPLLSVTDDDVTWNLNLQYRPDDNTMYYISAATGFKAGGFSMVAALSQDALEDTFAFGPEDTLNTEIGGRHSFDMANGTLNLNWTLFQLEINNQQVTALDAANVAQVVQANADAESKGLEIDGSWETEMSTISFDVAYTEAEYTSFTGASCWNGQTADEGCVDGVQNRTGTTLAQAPEWQGGINFRTQFAQGPNIMVTPYAEIRFVGEHYTSTALNPVSLNGDYTEVNAGVTLADAERGYELALIGTNLTDEINMGFFAETASIPGAEGKPQGAFAFPNPGRQIALVLRYRIGN